MRWNYTRRNTLQASALEMWVHILSDYKCFDKYMRDGCGNELMAHAHATRTRSHSTFDKVEAIHPSQKLLIAMSVYCVFSTDKLTDL